jgi:hypothetical protein
VSIEESGYKIVRGFIDPIEADVIGKQLKWEEKFTRIKQNYGEKVRFSDGLVNASFFKYGSLILESLMEKYQTKVEEVTGKELAPTYSYYRIYYKGSHMPPHTDREACQYSMSINFSCTEPASLYIRRKDGSAEEVTMNPGDAVIYKGEEMEHWRDVFHGEEFIQGFIHYVDVNGPHAEWKYDKRKYIGLPPIQKKQIGN